MAPLARLRAAALRSQGASRRRAGPSCRKNSCAEVSSFLANVTDFRTSVSGRYRIVATTIRFTNKLNRPLILGYVPSSGVDDGRSRESLSEQWRAELVRGIGLISSGALDVKFVLQPGESSDARFEFGWEPGHEIYGTAYEVELAIREIDQVACAPVHAREGACAAFSGFGTAPAVAAAHRHLRRRRRRVRHGRSGGHSRRRSLRGAPRCYSSGPFMAEVTRFTALAWATDRTTCFA